MRPLLPLALAIMLLPTASYAGEAAKTAKDCEAIEDAHAFNLCLASLQPARARVRADKAPPEDGVAPRRPRYASRARPVLSAQIYRPMGRSSPFLSFSGTRF